MLSSEESTEIVMVRSHRHEDDLESLDIPHARGAQRTASRHLTALSKLPHDAVTASKALYRTLELPSSQPERRRRMIRNPVLALRTTAASRGPRTPREEKFTPYPQTAVRSSVPSLNLTSHGEDKKSGVRKGRRDAERRDAERRELEKGEGESRRRRGEIPRPEIACGRGSMPTPATCQVKMASPRGSVPPMRGVMPSGGGLPSRRGASPSPGVSPRSNLPSPRGSSASPRGNVASPRCEIPSVRPPYHNQGRARVTYVSITTNDGAFGSPALHVSSTSEFVHAPFTSRFSTLHH